MWALSGNNLCTFTIQKECDIQEEKIIPWILPKSFLWDNSIWIYASIMPYSYKILYEDGTYAEDVDLVHGIPIITTIRKKNINGRIQVFIRNKARNKVNYYISFLAKRLNIIV